MKHPDLFDGMERTALFGGTDDCYRYELRRIWNGALPLLVVCMLNPSTADHLIDDPTIKTLVHFGKLWGYGGLLVVNFYAFRSSTPAALKAASDPEGTLNGQRICEALAYAAANGRKLLAAWGNHPAAAKWEPWLVQTAANFGVELVCLGTTLSGAPKHPMARGKHRIARDQQPIVWRAA